MTQPAWWARIAARGRRSSPQKAEPHYVKSYEAHVRRLRDEHELDAAMELAVGGDFDEIGRIERDVLRYAGLAAGMRIVDVGCGSGRLASQLDGLEVTYLGLDVVQELLDYAAARAPEGFVFRRHTDLSLPVPDESVDVVCFFSVLTHLSHAESYIYLRDTVRALKSTGRVVFSFLDFAQPSHWLVFTSVVATEEAGTAPHMNTFMDRAMIAAFAAALGLRIVEIVAGDESPWGGSGLGQCVAILEKSAGCSTEPALAPDPPGGAP